MKPTPFSDRIGRLIEARRRETPDVPLAGMEVLARARQLTQLSRKWIEPIFQSHGLDTGEFDVLATLERSGAPYRLRPTELFRELMMSSGGLTDRLDRLERKGMIRRAKSVSDQRSITVELTEAGRATIRKAFSEDMAVEFDLLESLTESERKMLARLLAKLLADWEKRE